MEFYYICEAKCKKINMKVSLMNLFEEAKNNQDFIESLKRSGENEFSEPKGYWKYEAKSQFAAVYLGWLMALEKFDPGKYVFPNMLASHPALN